MKYIKDQENLEGKVILLRLDLNVPLDQGKISDTTRIDKIIPTLNYLISQKTKIIILSHIGRPKGKIVNELYLKPIKEISDIAAESFSSFKSLNKIFKI